ncbi:DUF4124 domain-containing protein [Acinetobacter modestus]|uniref:DUF4124 domain-containing protein n=1 Tax=Acinetobacter modestus TaxID=1776740 RepID=UPI001F4B7A79|nr:DUF4124 domain-containing protein [Acinetobacter modestus]MCH7332627.1 DUF4124 domain-containing protein [Acinetobacter modestus]
MTKTLFQQRLLFFNLLFFIIPLNHAQDFYKWIDKNGTTHYTLNQPPTSANKVNKITTYGEKINSKDIPKKSEKNNSPSQNTDEREVTGNSFTILTNNGPLEIPPLKDGESITFNK